MPLRSLEVLHTWGPGGLGAVSRGRLVMQPASVPHRPTRSRGGDAAQVAHARGGADRRGAPLRLGRSDGRETLCPGRGGLSGIVAGVEEWRLQAPVRFLARGEMYT